MHGVFGHTVVYFGDVLDTCLFFFKTKTQDIMLKQQMHAEMCDLADDMSPYTVIALLLSLALAKLSLNYRVQQTEEEEEVFHPDKYYIHKTTDGLTTHRSVINYK